MFKISSVLFLPKKDSICFFFHSFWKTRNSKTDFINVVFYLLSESFQRKYYMSILQHYVLLLKNASLFPISLVVSGISHILAHVPVLDMDSLMLYLELVLHKLFVKKMDRKCKSACNVHIMTKPFPLYFNFYVGFGPLNKWVHDTTVIYRGEVVLALALYFM